MINLALTDQNTKHKLSNNKNSNHKVMLQNTNYKYAKLTYNVDVESIMLALLVKRVSKH